jgi:hypothetical protein
MIMRFDPKRYTQTGQAVRCHDAPSMNGLSAYIMNLPGASGQKAAKQVLDEDRDGHTLYTINIGTFIATQVMQADPAKLDLVKCDDMVAACFASEDYIEGRKAFMEKH